MSSSWSVGPGLQAFEDHIEAWDAANRARFSAHPLLESRFVLPLLRHFGGEQTVLASLSGPQGEFRGAMLLERRARGAWQTFLPSQAQIAPVVLPSLGVVEASSLMGALPGSCWVLDFLKQDREYSCFRDGLPDRAEEIRQATTIRIGLRGDFATYWHARRKHLRENMRRYFNRVRKQGIETSLKMIEAPDEVAPAVRRYGELESRGWKGAAGTAVHADNPQGRFYEQVLTAFAARGRGCVYELYFGDRLAASRLCISNDEMLVMLKTTYLEELRSYAPGRLLLYLLIEKEFEIGRYRVVEFYTNATKETREWGSDSRSIVHVTLYRHPFVQEGVNLLKRARNVVAGVAAVGTSDAAAPPPAVREPSEPRIERVASYERFMALEPEWRQCYETDGYRSVFLTHEWYENFIHEVVAQRERLSIYLVRSPSGNLEAIFPLMRGETSLVRMGVRSLTFLANYYSPVAKPLWIERDLDKRVLIAESVLKHLMTTDSDWDLLNLSPLPAETSDFDVLRHALARRGVAHVSYTATVNWSQPTEGLSGVEYSARLPSRVRRTLLRRTRRAERRGEVRCRIYREKEEIRDHMDEYYEVYARSWKRPEPYPTFHRRLAVKLAERSETLLAVLYFSGRPVAAQIWLVHEGVASILKLCYDRNHREFSFGTILTHRIMQHAIDELKVKAVDYLTGDDAYKRDWMSHRAERPGIMAFNRSARGRLLATSEVLVKPRLKELTRRRSSAETPRSEAIRDDGELEHRPAVRAGVSHRSG